MATIRALSQTLSSFNDALTKTTTDITILNTSIILSAVDFSFHFDFIVYFSLCFIFLIKSDIAPTINEPPVSMVDIQAKSITVPSTP